MGKVPAHWQAGHVVAGKYELISAIGQGGMGAVWHAVNRELDSTVALKQLDPELASSSLGRARFIREAKAAAALSSPHVIQVFDSGVDDDTPYLVMELLQGETLARRLDAGPLSAHDTLRIVTQIGRALRKAHDAGIVHRDLKPGNVFLIHNDDEELVKVLDFGIAKRVDAEAVTATATTAHPSTETGAVIGTPHYMSPEQARAKPVDTRSDLWSLGVVTYECLLGAKPFRADNFGAMVLEICSDPLPIPSEHGDVPDGFDAWFVKALARDPDARFQSAKEMVDALKAVVSGDGAPRSDHPSVSAPASSPRVTPSSSGSRAVSGISDTTTHPNSVENVDARPPRSRFTWFAVAAVVVLGVTVWVRGGGELDGEKKQPSVDEAGDGYDVSVGTPSVDATQANAEPAPSPTVVVTFRGAPDDASISQGDLFLGKAHEGIVLPRANQARVLEIRAKGYVARAITVVPRESQELEASLQPERSGTPARPASAGAPVKSTPPAARPAASTPRPGDEFSY